MTVGDFDLYGTLADQRSEERVDTVMLVATMPPWWIEVVLAVFAAPTD